jgi:transposase
MLTAEKNRLQQALPPVRPNVAAHIAWLEQALKELDGELDQLLRASPVWRERENLLRSVPGISPTTALTLLAELPELVQLDRKAIAALGGSRPSPARAEPGGADASSGVGALGCARRSTWPLWWPVGAIPR